MKALTPPEIVEELDKYIVGQKDAKRSVAVALRNRWRRAAPVLEKVQEAGVQEVSLQPAGQAMLPGAL